MPLPKLRPLLALSAAFMTLAIACGPDFQPMLAKRQVELSKPIQGNFYHDASHLVVRPALKLPGGDAEARHASAKPNAVIAEYEGLSPAQVTAVQKMRAAADGDVAYSSGSELAEALRAYTAGAVDYRLAQALGTECATSNDLERPNPECMVDDTHVRLGFSALQRTVKRLESVLKLKPDERKLRATWAAYSLGLAYSLPGDLHSPESADKYFQLTRQLAQESYPDPQYLALASLGAQALVHLDADDIPKAMELYAQQAAHGSQSGVESLVWVCKKLLNDPALLREHIRSPLVQQAVISFVLAYGDSTAHDDGQPAASGFATRSSKPSRLTLLTDALDVAGVKETLYADRLAAAAYGYGQFDMASRYAANGKTTLAYWVRAKLALRSGNTKEATSYFSKALAQMASASAADTPRDEDKRTRLVVENATLTLMRGDFLLAFQQMYSNASAYWLDVAYMAERVLTVDELKSYVDQHVPESAPPPHGAKGQIRPVQAGPTAQLRDLLARRLMREGRYDQAYAYFHSADDERFSNPNALRDAKAYARALHSAETAWTDIGRAKSLFEAASLARWKGMDILGFELAPDYFVVAGAFDFGAPVPQWNDMASKNELLRYKASAGNISKRFHYRYTASQLAIQSAQALPKRSETYAQVLNNASAWLIDRDYAQARKTYQIYVANGARVDWPTPFARSPLEPSFWRAYLFQARQSAHQLRLWARHHKRIAWTLILAAGLGLASLGWWIYRRRSELKKSATTTDMAPEQADAPDDELGNSLLPGELHFEADQT